MATARNRLRTTPQTVRVAGHRGHSSGAPENTMAAFRKAREIVGKGEYVTCETDLALTRDGELILIHDETVDRTTDGRGIVRDLTYPEIAKLDAGRWFDEAFAGERVPHLKDALLLARELGGIVFQLEIKVYDQNDVIFPKLRALIIDELGCPDLLQFSSFDFVQLRALKKAIPEVPTVGLSHSRMIEPALMAQKAGLDAMNLEIQHFPSGEAHQLHREGFAVFLYIPHKQLKSLQAYGADAEAQVVGWVREGLLDQILSDDVELMVRIANKARGSSNRQALRDHCRYYKAARRSARLVLHSLDIVSLYTSDSPLKRTIYTALLRSKRPITAKNLDIFEIPTAVLTLAGYDDLEERTIKSECLDMER